MQNEVSVSLHGVTDDGKGGLRINHPTGIAYAIVPDWTPAKDQKFMRKTFTRDLHGNVLVMTETIFSKFNAALDAILIEGMTEFGVPTPEEVAEDAEDLGHDGFWKIAQNILADVKRIHNTVGAN